MRWRDDEEFNPTPYLRGGGTQNKVQQLQFTWTQWSDAMMWDLTALVKELRDGFDLIAIGKDRHWSGAWCR